MSAVGSVTSRGIRPAPSSLLSSIGRPHSRAQHRHSIGKLAMIRRCVDSTFSSGTMQSRFGLYRTSLFEHNEPPR